MAALYELISAEEFDNLPEDPLGKFIELETICRSSLNRMINHDSSTEFDAMVRLQYMTTVAAAAEELGIEGISYPGHLDDPSNGIGGFMLDVSGVVTRARLRMGRGAKPFSVALSARTRGKIELQIRRLRDIINDSDMPRGRADAMLKKLDELSQELGQSRLGFAKAMTILAFVGAGVMTGTSFLADAPDALATITSLIGQDKQAEEAESARLGPRAPQKALPAPQKPAEDLDDIPF